MLKILSARATSFKTTLPGFPTFDVVVLLNSFSTRPTKDGKTIFFYQWHLGFFEKEYTPTYRGFESFYGFWNGKEDFWDHTSLEDVWGTDLRNNMKVRSMMFFYEAF